jgi:signal transduction histidine kinase
MLMPASSEFVTLCRTQLTLLRDGFGASLSAVYLSEEPTANQQTTLVPLVFFPEYSHQWPASVPLALPEARLHSTGPSQTSGYALPATLAAEVLPDPITASKRPANTLLPLAKSPQSEPMMLPLLQEGIMWGLLVVGREDRPWRKREQSQLQQIAQTLAIACVLDQRSQWLSQDREQRLLGQSQHQATLSTLLHQFRNPLTTLRTLGKLLFRRLPEDAANQELAQSIVMESDHLEQLLRQFNGALEETTVDLGEAALESTLESETTPVKPPPALPPGTPWLKEGALLLQPCWLHEVLLPILQASAGRLDEKDLQIQTNLTEHLPPIAADPIALREVLSNLVDNALKYTSPGGTIWVELTETEDALPHHQRVRISDSGPGIPTEDLERIFERNYRGIQAQTTIPGTGLGLAIARDLVDQMQGKLQAFSPALVTAPEATGRGSTFQLTLPEYRFTQ